MTPDIRELDAKTRDRIAAGEVVERPASVVKELLENALDADASRIEVHVEAGGKDRIAIADDGVGMSESDARMAVREHTTSKLRSIDDLDAIGTLGFRGEALHAIGSVAQVTIRTRPQSGDRGTELVVEDGDVVDCSPAGRPGGTTVEVTDLFGSVPARRKYLKTDATEFDRVQQVVAGYALANPDVAIALEHGDREAFSTPGDGNRQSAVLSVYGREVAESMIPVGTARDGSAARADADGPLSGIDGLVSHPETNRAGREYMTTLVDGRYVTSRLVREAVVDAYGSQLAPDRYPFAVIDLDVPPGGVDVNVHPRKLEVLFADEDGVREQVTEAIETALLADGSIRSRAPRGRSAPEQTEITTESPESDPEPTSEVAPASTPSVEPDDTVIPDGLDSDGRTSETLDEETASGSAEPVDATTDEAAETPDSDPIEPDPASEEPETMTPRQPEAGASDPVESEKFRETPTQRTLSGAETSGTPEALEQLPSMTVLGQFDDTYVVAETDAGLLLIDQHAADERVNYERLREAFAGDVTTQTLAEPVELELTTREAALIEEYADAVARLGFHLRRSDDRTIAVTTVPALLAERAGEEAPELVVDLLGEFAAGDPSGTVERVVDELLGDLACHPSIQGNTSLGEGTIVDLLSALDDCENPYACPHGRPTVIELSHDEIEDRFERDYPGHAGRRDR